MTEAVIDVEEQEVDLSNMRGITFLNGTGDLTICWDEKHDEKMKALIRKKMAEGYVFFTTREVPLTNIKYKRKLGKKGVDSAKDLIIDDKTFERFIKDLDDEDVAKLIRTEEKGIGLGKRSDGSKKWDGVKKAKDADEVVSSKRALATRGLAGG